MELNTVAPELLVSLDATMHQREIVEVRASLLSFKPRTIATLEAHVTKGTTPTTVGFSYEKSGIRFVRSQNVLANVLGGDFNYISNECNAALKRSQLIRGDVLINLVGASIGRCCVYSLDERANTNQAVGRIRFNNSVDSHFVSTWLNCRFAQKLIAAEQSGLARDNFDLEQVRELMIPSVDLKVQKYIGDKVRQAERLRASAIQNREQLVKHFASLVPIDANITQSKTSRISNLDVVPRLNAEYYGEKYTSVERSVIGCGRGYSRLGNLCKVVRSKARPNTDCTYFEIGNIDTSTGEFLEGTRHTCGTVPNNAQRVFESGEIAVSTRRPNRGAIALVRETNPNNFYSVFLARLKPNDTLASNWIREFLRSPAGRLLLEQRCTWTTYPVISEDDLATVPIPNDEENWDMVDRLCTLAYRCESIARILVNAAKTLIEALIQRNVSEDELIFAQTRLEQGDDAADRAILSRLFEGGWDATETRPLLPDLDVYYETLRMVEREKTEVAAK